METFKSIWAFIAPVVKNKYILSVLIFILWIGVFDSYNLIDRIQDVNQLRELQKERDYFKEEIQNYRTQIRQLESSPQMLEKFAREQHLMKAKDEDVFIILDKDD
ncbi:MAG TPA: septum formation initiator family protein [Bacteroidales bacterium]|nr:septum formation initiator family protein [Bacteroidales bacterium]